MRRPILLSFAWIAASVAFYACFLFLELYWNLVTWRPRLDLISVLLVGAIIVLVCVFDWLANRIELRLSRVIAMLCSVALLALGIYTFPREPLSEGLLGRQAASPLLYRSLRLVGLGLPAVCWLGKSLWRNRQSS